MIRIAIPGAARLRMNTGRRHPRREHNRKKKRGGRPVFRLPNPPGQRLRFAATPPWLLGRPSLQPTLPLGLDQVPGE